MCLNTMFSKVDQEPSLTFSPHSVANLFDDGSLVCRSCDRRFLVSLGPH